MGIKVMLGRSGVTSPQYRVSGDYTASKVSVLYSVKLLHTD